MKLTITPLRSYMGIFFLLSLASFAVVVYKPPLWFSMPLFAIQILFGIIALVRAVAEANARKRKT